MDFDIFYKVNSATAFRARFYFLHTFPLSSTLFLNKPSRSLSQELHILESVSLSGF